MALQLNFDLASLDDGPSVSALIQRCPPLDTNSAYCNLLQCGHFATTSVVAKVGVTLVGFTSGYRLPEHTDTLFIWQVAVAAEARGNGVAGRMLESILRRDTCSDVRFIQTTITADNRASWALFEGFAERCSGDMSRAPLFDKSAHFNGQHDSEILLTIGPIKLSPE